MCIPMVRTFCHGLKRVYDVNVAASRGASRRGKACSAGACATGTDRNGQLGTEAQRVRILSRCKFPWRGYNQAANSATTRYPNEPYRTLSRWVRDGLGYVKPQNAMYFMEFKWGAYMRDHGTPPLEDVGKCQRHHETGDLPETGGGLPAYAAVTVCLRDRPDTQVTGHINKRFRALLFL